MSGRYSRVCTNCESRFTSRKITRHLCFNCKPDPKVAGRSANPMEQSTVHDLAVTLGEWRKSRGYTASTGTYAPDNSVVITQTRQRLL